MYDQTQKQFFQFLRPLTHLRFFDVTPSKKNLCGQATARKENSCMYDHTKKLVFKVSRSLTKLTKNLNFTNQSLKDNKKRVSGREIFKNCF